MLGLAVAILMVIEARRVGVKFVWAYIIGAFAIAISAVFPLFLSLANCAWRSPMRH